MPEISHLSRAPIVEALVNFQANAARLWQPEQLRSAFAAKWPVHTEIQEIRPLEINLTQTPDGPLPPEVKSHIQGLMFRSKTQTSVHQARRDGYAFSKLAPYEDWLALETSAFAGWEDFKGILEPEELNAVAVRFINRMEFPQDGFKLSRYFTTPPVPPPGLNWKFHGFMHHTLYAVDESQCMVQAIIKPEFLQAPAGPFPFTLDVEITLKESLPALGRDVREVLNEMHDLKNKAFFHLLTEEALQLYK
jgi:uncharacterized protein (TIGR04255 family)